MPTILPMAQADLDEVMRIENQVYPFPWTRTNFEDSITSGYLCRVYRLNTELLGYFVLLLVLDESHLLNISVKESYQGRGYGAKLLRNAMQLAFRTAAKTLFLEVRPSNHKAIKLYQHFGFKTIGVRKAYYPAAEGQREDAIVMSRHIEEVFV